MFDGPLAEARRQLLGPGVIWKKPGKDLADLALSEIIERAVIYLRENVPAAKFVSPLRQV